MLQVFILAPEFNYPYASPGRTPIALPLSETLNFAVNQTDPIELLAKVNWMWYGPLGAECLDLEHWADFFKNVAVPAINYEYFSYISCKFQRMLEFIISCEDACSLGAPGTYDPMRSTGYISNLTIFPERAANGTTQNIACEFKYGTPTLTKAQIESRYHLSPAELQNSTHIIFSKGEYDPNGAMEPSALPLTANGATSRVLYAIDMAHREDLFRSDERDRESTTLLRRQELEIIKGWLEVDI